MKIAVIGAGISGLSIARMLVGEHDITVYEKEHVHGGLLKCRSVGGSLFHMCGGHVFNTKRKDVLEWFWQFFDQETEFIKADRNSVVFLNDDKIIPYPIENHIYLLDRQIQQKIIRDLTGMCKLDGSIPTMESFEDFLLHQFGETLYKLYFQPYNKKVWGCDLKHIPLSWLDGKLPMPSIDDIIFNNFNHIKENSFVHSSFWYSRSGGSQFLVDTLSKGLDIRYDLKVDALQFLNGKWNINSIEYDRIIYCGNIKDLIHFVSGIDLKGFLEEVDALKYHGTTTVFCEIDKNPYSWVYQPRKEHHSHRIICTGNFAESNNSESVPHGRITATIEFTDRIDKDIILQDLQLMPFHPKYLDHTFNQYTYPIQSKNTREMICQLKKHLAQYGCYLTGRFADWEYYNMDAAIGAAIDMVHSGFFKQS